MRKMTEDECVAMTNLLTKAGMFVAVVLNAHNGPAVSQLSDDPNKTKPIRKAAREAIEAFSEMVEAAAEA